MSSHRPARRRHRLDHNPRRGRYWRAPQPDDEDASPQDYRAMTATAPDGDTARDLAAGEMMTTLDDEDQP